MASLRSTTKTPVGSVRWVYDEREQANQFIDQEAEEFAFSARNELEWLNEHMSDIFSRSHFDITEAFKTPGKLRGKTPRTARKHTPGQARAPLTDIFSSNSPAQTHSAQANGFHHPISRLQMQADKENSGPATRKSLQAPAPHIDSGYHDMLSDQENANLTSPIKHAPKLLPKSPERHAKSASPSPSRVRMLQYAENGHKSPHAPLVSTKEDRTMDMEPAIPLEENNAMSSPVPAEPSLELAQEALVPEGLVCRTSNHYSVSTTTADGLGSALEEAGAKSPHGSPKSRSPSRSSSPEPPIIRKKSSLNFAALPAREPLSTKMSMGARLSQRRGSTRTAPSLRESTTVRPAIAQGTGEEGTDAEDLKSHRENVTTSINEPAELHETSAQPSKLCSKTSTQRLHERITMLGQTKQARPSRSISHTVARIHSAIPQEAQAPQLQRAEMGIEETDDEWIAPISERTTQCSQIMPGSFNTASGQWMNQTQESTLIEPASSTDAYVVESKKQPSIQAKTSYPRLTAPTAESHTPTGSPAASRWQVDGPLSASKAKFSSFLKSAKGIFASSGAVSAQAKVETFSAGRSQPQMDTDMFEPPDKIDGAVVFGDGDDTPVHQTQKIHQAEAVPPRRSSERLRAQKDDKLAADDGVEVEQGDHVDKDGNVPRTKQEIGKSQGDPATSHEKGAAGPEKSDSNASRKSKFLGSASQSGDVRRPMKVTKPQTGPAKGSFSIRVPSQKTLGALNASTLGNAEAQEAAPAPSGPARPPLTKKGSSSSLRSTSTTLTSKTAGTTISRVKALDAAAKMKHKTERERQRKLDEKRERQRKRAQAEEEKKRLQAEKQATEQQRERDEQDARVAAQRQRAEAQRKNEQLRQQAEAARATTLQQQQQQQQQELASKALSSQKQQEANSYRAAPRADRETSTAASIRPHVNPAKPKRYLQPDADDESQSSNRAEAAQNPSTFVAANGSAKRRKTNERDADVAVAAGTRPTMAPPVRPSMNRKQEIPLKFAQGYMSSNAAAAPPPNLNASMLKTAVTANHQIAHGGPKTPHAMTDLAKFSNTRVPFAEAPNPPGQQQHGRNHKSQLQKIPGTAQKSSPQYPAGETISLPEIATDSEDSEVDDDDGFVPPAWANSPELRTLLAQQQLQDPREIFGPIAPLAMEEVFKGGSKERAARFRNRTSSANWAGTDRLTEEERRRDREARERLEKEGGWTYRADV